MLTGMDTLITMRRSGRALIQSTHLNLYSDGEPVPSALSTDMDESKGWDPLLSDFHLLRTSISESLFPQ